MPGVMVEWKTVPEVEADSRFADDDKNKEFRRYYLSTDNVSV